MMQTLLICLLLLTSRAGTDDPPWERVVLEGSGVEVLMPGTPKIIVRKLQPTPQHETELHLASVTIKGGKALFMLGFHDLDFDASDEVKVREVLDGGVKGSLLNALGKVSKHQRIKFGEYPGRQFEYVGKRFDQPILGTSRIYLVGRRVFQISVIRAPGIDVAAETTKFFDSFKFATAVAPATTEEAFSTDEEPPAEPSADKPKPGGGK